MDVKDGLRKSLFDYLDACLPNEVKAKLKGPDTKEIIDWSIEWVYENHDRIVAACIDHSRSPVPHRLASSFSDRQNSDTDKEPGFLDDLAKV